MPRNTTLVERQKFVKKEVNMLHKPTTSSRENAGRQSRSNALPTCVVCFKETLQKANRAYRQNKTRSRLLRQKL